MSALPRLSATTLDHLPDDVARPLYDRSRITPGVVHLGLGAFHRGHQAVFFDDALNRGETDWGIVAVSLRSPETRDALAPQDGLYTYVQRQNGTDRPRVIGSILDMLVAPEDPEAVVAALADPRIRLVTLTVTENGYGLDVMTGALDETDAALASDLAGGAPLRSVLGFLVAAIGRRQAAGLAPFALISCDNLADNGGLLRKGLMAFAQRRAPQLVDHIGREVACLSSMVDRIVPATSDSDRALVAERLGLSDAWPVISEPAFAWVITDRFPAGRPPLAPSGVEFVADIAPHEDMKLRLLNGAHTSIAAIGRLAGIETVPEAMAQPVIVHFLSAYWRAVLPTVSIDRTLAEAYAAALPARFGNTSLPHRTAQIATDASLKVPQRLVAPLGDLLATTDRVPWPLAFALAAYIRSSGGVSDAGTPFELRDPFIAAWAGRPDQSRLAPAEIVAAFLGQRALFPAAIAAHPALAPALTHHLGRIASLGSLAALDAALSSDVR